MARVLHLLKGDHAAQAVAVITPQAAAGDRVTVALLGDTAAPSLPAGVEVRRIPADTSYGDLVELIFEADHVVTW